MSDHGDEGGLDELERQLDAAFATTRPRRGFEDELWTRIESRRRRWPPRLAWPRELPWAMAGSLAVLLVIGLVAVTLARSDGGRGGGSTHLTPHGVRLVQGFEQIAVGDFLEDKAASARAYRTHH